MMENWENKLIDEQEGDWTEHVRRMMRRGFDQAFLQQIMHLYQIYLTNIATVGDKQREYTKTGIENAVKAYRLAREAVEEWEG
jgi:hypothetical protein